MTEFVQWLGWLNIAMLGNIPSQDLMQRCLRHDLDPSHEKPALLLRRLSLGVCVDPVGLSFMILFPNRNPVGRYPDGTALS